MGVCIEEEEKRPEAEIESVVKALVKSIHMGGGVSSLRRRHMSRRSCFSASNSIAIRRRIDIYGGGKSGVYLMDL